ncbi:MAG: glycosyltransferase family 4 protein [Bacteroidetes bacterium]|nr:glycosyltransferase family 4 protein [Bacteroidota bacterium]
MNNSYIYPVNANSKPEVYNPYIENFILYLSSRFNFLNKNDYSKVGILNIVKYHFRIKYIFLHWIENVPDRKFGVLQSLFFILYLFVFKGNRKIVWVMHNRISHFKEHLYLKRLLFKLVLKKSYFIFTHSSDGVEYARELGRTDNVVYLAHPVVFHENASQVKEFDILIWGSILPYKGIDSFYNI